MTYSRAAQRDLRAIAGSRALAKQIDDKLGDISFSRRYQRLPGAEPWLLLREKARGVVYYALFRPGDEDDVRQGRPEKLRLVARVVERTAVLPTMNPPPDPSSIIELVQVKDAQQFG